MAPIYDERLTMTIRGTTPAQRLEIYKMIRAKFPEVWTEFRPDLIGSRISKEFSDGKWYNGTVHSYDFTDNVFRIKYDDGDREYMSLRVVEKCLKTPPWTLIESIEWIDKSGRSSHSFGRMLREMIDDRQYIMDKLPEIFMKVCGADIGEVEKIGPGLWAQLGSCEEEKWYYAKRILAEVDKM